MARKKFVPRDVPDDQKNFRVDLILPNRGGAFGYGIDVAEAEQHARHFLRSGWGLAKFNGRKIVQKWCGGRWVAGGWNTDTGLWDEEK